MSNTSQSQDPRSSNQQRNTRNPPEPSSPLFEGGMGQPSKESVINTDIGTFATNLGGDDMKVKVIEIGFTSAGSKNSSMKARTAIVNCRKSQDILASLRPFAKEEDMCIVGAAGTVSHVEFINRQGAPVDVHRDFQIVSLEGNVVYPKENGKNSSSWANVMLSGENGFLGGPVKSLIAKSHVQVILSTVGISNIQSKATEDMVKDENFAVFLNHVNAANEMMNKVYEETMKELNQS